MAKLFPRTSMLKKIAKGASKSSDKKPHSVDPSPDVEEKITSYKKKK